MKPDQEKPLSGTSTRAVHAGGPPHKPGVPVVNPIVPSSTFYTEAHPQGEVLYTRYGTNPNHLILSEKLAQLEGAEAAIALGSGQAAIALSLLTQVGAGDHIVAQRELYGGTLTLLDEEFPRLGIETTYVDHDNWEAVIRPNTRVLLLECPVNPTLRIPNVPNISALARARGIPLFIDATFGGMVNFRAVQLGATVAIHSATKYLGGHADVTAGVVAGPKGIIEAVRTKLKSFGSVIDPHCAWLLERGIKTLAVRMERHNRNGLMISQMLENHPAVERVFYPGLPSHPDHDMARLMLDGFGGMVSFVMRGGDDAAVRVCSRLRLISNAPSLGGVETLVSMPRFTSHASLSAEDRHSRGIADGFIRVSLGIEDPEDIWSDLEQALAAELARTSRGAEAAAR